MHRVDDQAGDMRILVDVVLRAFIVTPAQLAILFIGEEHVGLSGRETAERIVGIVVIDLIEIARACVSGLDLQPITAAPIVDDLSGAFDTEARGFVAVVLDIGVPFDAVVPIENVLVDVAVNLGMPQMADGDRVAANVQRRLRPENRGPHLVHPYGQEHGPKLDKPPQGLSPRPDYRALHDQLDSPFTDLQWQFTIEYAKNRGTYAPGKPEKTAEDTVAVAHEDGLGQVAADANHLLAVRQGYQFTVDEAEAIVAWLANNRQLGVFEFDVQPHLGGKIATLESVIQGNIEETDHGRLLAVAAQNTPPGDPFNLKVEVPAYAFEANFENGGLGFDYETGHKWLVPILTNHIYDNLPAAA